MIDGVFVEPLKTFADERGKIMHMLRSEASFFERFGEVYFSLIKPGFIKGWKKHLKITQHFAVPVGNIKLVLYDDRVNSSTAGRIQEVFVGAENYQLVRIPPLVLYSFKAVGDKCALIANCINFPYDPDEVITFDVYDKTIPYTWNSGDSSTTTQ